MFTYVCIYPVRSTYVYERERDRQTEREKERERERFQGSGNYMDPFESHLNFK